MLTLSVLTCIFVLLNIPKSDRPNELTQTPKWSACPSIVWKEEDEAQAKATGRSSEEFDPEKALVCFCSARGSQRCTKRSRIMYKCKVRISN